MALLELNFDRMAVLRDGKEVAPIFETWSYGKDEAEALAAEADKLGRKLTDDEAEALLFRLNGL